MASRLSSYLDELPAGLGSYPECEAKASLLRALLEACPPLHQARLPAELSELLLRPPGANSWIPEVHLVAAHLVIAEALGLSDEEMLERTYQANRALTRSPMYRALARVASPMMLLRGAKAGWGLLHRGVHLTLQADSGRARVVLTHPPNLYNRLAHESAARGFCAVVEAAHGRAVTAELEQSLPSGTSLMLRWA